MSKTPPPAKSETSSPKTSAKRGPTLNQVTLLGNLCNDPELRYTQGGTAVASFRLAVNTYYSKDDTTKQDTAFVAVTTWAGLAETVAKFMKKGRLILLSGRLVTHTWETEQGEKRSALQVTAESIQFLGTPSKPESSEQ